MTAEIDGIRERWDYGSIQAVKPIIRDVTTLLVEIDRLTAEVERLAKGHDEYNRVNQLLEAEVERLREALEPFAEGHTGGWGYGCLDSEPACHVCSDAKWDDERMLHFTVGHFRRAKDALGIEYSKPPDNAHAASEETSDD